MNTQADFRFDGWAVCRGSGELEKAERRIRLQRQPFEVLVALLEQPGAVVSREKLIARLWPRGVVEYDVALNSAVRRLRMALGDNAEVPRYVETLPRRGYRFIGTLESTKPVLASTPEAVVAPGSSRHWRVAGVATLALCACVALVASGGGASPRQSAEAASALAPSEAAVLTSRARQHLLRRGDGDVAQAKRLLQQAVRLDPRLAEAWAGLASAWWLEAREGRVAPVPGERHAWDAAERALALDPRQVEALLRLSNLSGYRGDRSAADDYLRRAAEVEPDHPLLLAFQASQAASDGEFERAIALQHRGIAADPGSTVQWANLVSWLYLLGRYEEAAEVLAGMRARVPDSAFVRHMLALLLVQQGRNEEAMHAAEQVANRVERLHAQALAYSAAGREPEARAALAELQRVAVGSDAVLIAQAYAYRNELDQAFHWLDVAKAGDPELCGRDACAYVFELRSPLLEPLRRDPRWTAYLGAAAATQAVRAADVDA